MKKIVMLGIMIVLLISMAAASTNSAVVSLSSNAVDGRVEIVRYSPLPAEPGENLDIWVSFETQASQNSKSIVSLADLQGVELELVETDVFTLVDEDDAVKELGAMRMGEQAVVKYSVRVSDEAFTGDNPLTFLVRTSDNPNGVETAELDISVQASDASLNIASVTTSPEQLSPGQAATLDITIDNGAQATFLNLQAILNIEGSTIPIVPYKSSKEQNLRSLSSGESHTFSFSIIAEEDATAGVHKIPFELSYSDTEGTVLYRNDTFGVLVGAEGDLSFNLEEFDTFQKGTKGNIVASVSNVGPTELKFMELTILDGEDYVVVGPNKEYLGNLDSDDFETSSFDVYVTSGDAVSLNFLVEYKDAYNEAFEETFSLTLPVYSGSEVRKYGLAGSNGSSFTFLLYIVLILFIYWGYKGWRAKKGFEGAIKFAFWKVVALPFKILFFFRPRNLRSFPRRIRKFIKKVT